MGEMADDAYDRALWEMEDMECDPDLYGGGYSGSLSQLFGGFTPQRPTEGCPHCGQRGLERSGRGADSYLFKPGLGRHICHQKTINDFDDLDDLSDLL